MSLELAQCAPYVCRAGIYLIENFACRGSSTTQKGFVTKPLPARPGHQPDHSGPRSVCSAPMPYFCTHERSSPDASRLWSTAGSTPLSAAPLRRRSWHQAASQIALRARSRQLLALPTLAAVRRSQDFPFPCCTLCGMAMPALVTIRMPYCFGRGRAGCAAAAPPSSQLSEGSSRQRSAGAPQVPAPPEKFSAGDVMPL